MTGIALYDNRAQDTVGNLIPSVKLSGKIRLLFEVDQGVIALVLLLNGISKATLPPIVNTLNSTVLCNQSLEFVYEFRVSSSPILAVVMMTVS